MGVGNGAVAMNNNTTEGRYSGHTKLISNNDTGQGQFVFIIRVIGYQVDCG